MTTVTCSYMTLTQLRNCLRGMVIGVIKETYGRGRDRKLLIDTESRAIESLYVEASVPG